MAESYAESQAIRGRRRLSPRVLESNPLVRLIGLVPSEFRRFAAVGLINTMVDVGLFDGAHFVGHIGAVTSKLLSGAVATVVSYGLTRTWAFAHREHSLSFRNALGFVAINVVGIGLAVGSVAVVRYGLGQDGFVLLTVVGNGLGIALGMTWRYWSLRRWVFLDNVGVFTCISVE